MARTIQSPGVEIKEIDLTLRPAIVAGTTVFVPGFASQGPIDEVLQPSNVSEFELIYGKPTNSAERYFYHTVRSAFQSPANVLVSRLPYGTDLGEGFESVKYSALAYPVQGWIKEQTSTSNVTQSISFTFSTSSNETFAQALTSGSENYFLSGAAIKLAASPALASGVAVAFRRASNSIINYNDNLNNFTTRSVITLSGSYTNFGQYVEEIKSHFASNATLAANFTINSVVSSSTGFSFNIVNSTTGATNYTSQSLYNGTYTSLSGGSKSVSTFVESVNAIGQSAATTYGSTTDVLSAATHYYVGRPTHVELSADEYQALVEGNINWAEVVSSASKNTAFTYSTLGNAAVIILNQSQTTINNKFEGYYLGLTDNNNYNPATDYDSLLTVESINNNNNTKSFVNVPKARLSFSLSATKYGDGSSPSEVMENLGQFDLNSTAYNDTVSLGLFKLRQSIFTPDVISLDYVLSEGYVGSFDYHRQIADQNGGAPRTFFLGSQTSSSPNIRVLVNPYLSNKYTNTWLDANGVPSKSVRLLTNRLANLIVSPGFNDTAETYYTRVGTTSATINSFISNMGTVDSLFPVGVYSDTVIDDKSVGNLPAKLDRVFELIDNSDVYPINVVAEGGLSTVYVNAIEQSGNPGAGEAGSYVESTPLLSLSALYVTNNEITSEEGLRLKTNYKAITDRFVEVAEKKRKDFMVILDPLRNVFVQGDNSKVINSKKVWSPNAGIGNNPNAPGYVTANFSQHIYWPLRHLIGTTNSSYAATYGNFAQVVDPVLNRPVWVPFSGFAAATMANTDSNFQPWIAPAGFTRGIVTGATDLAIYPKQNQRDQLYKISINPVALFPSEGFVVFGQKTLLKRPSAFDRINVRRLFLDLEIKTRNTVKYFVFEPNTVFTRSQVVNTLSPVFEEAKATDGLYDYLLVCDERNNTPDVIDQNEMKIDIYIKPVRTAEFILVSFYATRTSTNFQELVG